MVAAMFTKIKRLNKPDIETVSLTDKVLAPRVKKCLSSTIPSAIKKAYESGRVDAFDIENFVLAR